MSIQSDPTTDPVRFFGIDIVCYYIFSRLNAKELATCTLVSKIWNRIATDDGLWRRLYPEVPNPSAGSFREYMRQHVVRDWKELLKRFEVNMQSFQQRDYWRFSCVTPYIKKGGITLDFGYDVPSDEKIPRVVFEYIWLYKPSLNDKRWEHSDNINPTLELLGFPIPFVRQRVLKTISSHIYTDIRIRHHSLSAVCFSLQVQMMIRSRFNKLANEELDSNLNYLLTALAISVVGSGVIYGVWNQV